MPRGSRWHAVSRATEVCRQLGAPRRRGNDITIGITAVVMKAHPLSRNAGDFAGIPDLEVEGTDINGR